MCETQAGLTINELNMVTLQDIKQAQSVLRKVAVRTPLVSCRLPHGRQVFVKPENLQPIGSFKLRGAYNKISSLSAEQRSRGVVSHSSGNHAQGVAYAARVLNVKATIVMPSSAPSVKMEATRALGAEIVMVGPASNDRIQRRSEEHTSELQSLAYLVCRLLLEKKKKNNTYNIVPIHQTCQLNKHAND